MYFYPLSVINAYNRNAQGGDGVPGRSWNDPFNASTVRIASISHRLIYIGPSSTASGVITVTPNKIVPKEGPNQTTSSTAGAAGAVDVYAANGTVNNTLTTGAAFHYLDGNLSPTAFARNSAVTRVDQGANILASHGTGPFRFLPISKVGLGMCVPPPTSIAEESTRGVHIFQYIGANTTLDYVPSVYAFDNDWSGEQIVVAGANADSKFRFETSVCLELNPEVASAFAPLSKAKGVNRPDIIRKAEEIIKSHPVSTPLTEAGSFRHRR